MAAKIVVSSGNCKNHRVLNSDKWYQFLCMFYFKQFYFNQMNF